MDPRTLPIGTLVRALRALDPAGANVAEGEAGSIHEEADGDFGPVVVWSPTEGPRFCCVYEGDVETVVDTEAPTGEMERPG